MKVLFCTRKDYLSRMAGDTIQLLKTKNELEKLGVQVDVNDGSISEYQGYDIIHIFNITRIDGSYIHFLRARRTKTPIVVSPIFWNLEDYYGFIKKSGSLKKWNSGMDMRRKILEGSQGIYPNSEIESLHIKDMFGIDERFQVVYNGCDIHEMVQEDRLDRTVLCSGRICRRKNQLILAKICYRMGLKLHLVGPVNDPGYLKECLKYKGVQYKGVIENGNMYKLYRKYRTHALISYLETPGLATLEAAEQGCNIITTNIGSCREYLKDYGAYCNPYDENSIIEAFNIEGNRGYEINDIRNFIHRNYSWEKVIKTLYEDYKIILRG